MAFTIRDFCRGKVIHILLHSHRERSTSQKSSYFFISLKTKNNVPCAEKTLDCYQLVFAEVQSKKVKCMIFHLLCSQSQRMPLPSLCRPESSSTWRRSSTSMSTRAWRSTSSTRWSMKCSLSPPDQPSPSSRSEVGDTNGALRSYV